MTKKHNILTIIPARAGSKRIPGKNIRDFLGKPLIAHTILQALECDFIECVMVDTDSEDIAKIAKKFGAQVPWLRPKKLADDTSRIIDSVLYTLDRFKKEKNYEPDYVMILQTTSPLREKKDIVDCWRLMQKIKIGTVLTVCPTHPRLYYLDKKRNTILVNGKEDQSSNIQEWRPGYRLNGCFVYMIKTSDLLAEKSIITKNTKAVICSSWRSIDLDTHEDWVLAEHLYEHKEKIASRIKKLSNEKS